MFMNLMLLLQKQFVKPTSNVLCKSLRCPPSQTLTKFLETFRAIAFPEQEQPQVPEPPKKESEWDEEDDSPPQKPKKPSFLDEFYHFLFFVYYQDLQSPEIIYLHY